MNKTILHFLKITPTGLPNRPGRFFPPCHGHPETLVLFGPSWCQALTWFCCQAPIIEVSSIHRPVHEIPLFVGWLVARIWHQRKLAMAPILAFNQTGSGTSVISGTMPGAGLLARLVPGASRRIGLVAAGRRPRPLPAQNSGAISPSGFERLSVVLACFSPDLVFGF
jgi:hypothetical protein